MDLRGTRSKLGYAKENGQEMAIIIWYDDSGSCDFCVKVPPFYAIV